MSQPKYKFYATLLDAFQWYLDTEQETAEQDFLDKINRVPFQSDAAEKGSAFNDVLDIKLKQVPLPEETRKSEELLAKYKFNSNLLYELSIRLCGSVPQYFCKRTLETSKGTLELYGYVDYILYQKAIDLKTTKTYTLGKYATNWQQVVYPWCLAGEGVIINEFEFLVTDFENIYREPYPVNLHNGYLIWHCERLIDFIESKKMFITDKKIFGGENEINAERHKLVVQPEF